MSRATMVVRAVREDRLPVNHTIPQSMAKTAAFRLRAELLAALFAARENWKAPNPTCQAMWARIGQAVQTFERDMRINE